ncbi:MAG TPA: hypothetical protein VJS64_11665, partial [Pyrinomonadaceae bacterium]|nr:hypothetical protein [Pyrinomonadaceae bacterium]
MKSLLLSMDGETETISSGDLTDDAIATSGGGTLSLVNDVIRGLRNQPLSDLSRDKLEIPFSASRALGWRLNFGSGGTLTFGLSPDVEGKVAIRRSGEVFRFSEAETDEDESKLQTISVPAGKAYVSILLRVSLEATGAGQFSHGAFGVKANIDTNNLFRIANHVCLDASLGLRDAVVAAFSRFVLPFQDDIAAKLQQNDFLEYEFFGKLAFGVAATFGFGGAIFGGRSGGELMRSLNSPIGSIVAKAKPTFKLGAEFGVNYEHEDAFRFVLGSQASDRTRLFIFKMDRSALTTSLTASASVSVGASVNIESKVNELIDQAAQRLFGGIANETVRNTLIGQFKTRVASSQEELDKFVEQANTQVSRLLKQLERLKVEASITHERISEHTALFTYDFQRPVAAAAFKLAMQGNFLAAMEQPGVSLGEGSFVRRSLVQRTTVSFQFFELFTARTIEEYFKEAEIFYAGNGVFQFRSKAGLRAQSEVFGHNKAIEIYFAASASSDTPGVIRDQDLRLHINTTEANDRTAANQTAGALVLLLSDLPESDLPTRLRDSVSTNNRIAVKLSVVFAPSAFRRLRATPFLRSDRPHDLPHTEDQLNYQAFVRAVDSIYDHSGFKEEGFPNALDKFSDWSHYNVTVNDQEESRKPPNRRRVGNPAIWPQSPGFRGSSVRDTGIRAMLRLYFVAAQRFMNLCEDLPALAADLDEATTQERFEELLDSMKDLVKKDAPDFPLFFTKPMLAALMAQT